MIPIYEQGSGHGIGHGLESFLERFEDIALQHIEEGRAKSLAFVFYDFSNQDFKKILKDQGVFTQLDRLSGKDLSVFYVHSGNDQLLNKFNSTLMGALGVKKIATTPCVVFCNATPEGFTDISVANLESADLVHGFHELYRIIESYLEGGTNSPEPKYIQWAKGSLKFLSLESRRSKGQTRLIGFSLLRR